MRFAENFSPLHALSAAKRGEARSDLARGFVEALENTNVAMINECYEKNARVLLLN